MLRSHGNDFTPQQFNSLIKKQSRFPHPVIFFSVEAVNSGSGDR
jgi:hypothetical protein